LDLPTPESPMRTTGSGQLEIILCHEAGCD
jgi:hypothetical protein